MKLIINIHDYRFEQCQKDITTLDLFEELVDAVKNGTPLNECDSDHIPTTTITVEEYMKLREQEPVIDKIFSIVYPLSIMSTDKMEHEAIMKITEMLEPLHWSEEVNE